MKEEWRKFSLSENFNKDFENKKNQAGMSTITKKLKQKQIRGVNSRLDDREEYIRNLEDRIVETTQSELPTFSFLT